MPPTTAVLESGSTTSTWSKADTSRPGWLWPPRSRAGSRNRNRFDVRLASRTGAPGGMAAYSWRSAATAARCAAMAAAGSLWATSVMRLSSPFVPARVRGGAPRSGRGTPNRAKTSGSLSKRDLLSSRTSGSGRAGGREGGEAVVGGVAGGDLFGGHGQAGQGGGCAGVDGVAEQQGHGVAGAGGQGAVQGHVGQGAVAGLPGGEGEQAGRGREVGGLGPADHVGPEPGVGGVVAGVHPGPGVVADPQAGQGQGQPGDLVIGDETAAAAVGGQRVGDRGQALEQDQAAGLP